MSVDGSGSPPSHKSIAQATSPATGSGGKKSRFPAKFDEEDAGPKLGCWVRVCESNGEPTGRFVLYSRISNDVLENAGLKHAEFLDLAKKKAHNGYASFEPKRNNLLSVDFRGRLHLRQILLYLGSKLLVPFGTPHGDTVPELSLTYAESEDGQFFEVTGDLKGLKERLLSHPFNAVENVENKVYHVPFDTDEREDVAQGIKQLAAQFGWKIEPDWSAAADAAASAASAASAEPSDAASATPAAPPAKRPRA
jgi:hypothetical protein